jgi:hypothetical protein
VFRFKEQQNLPGTTHEHPNWQRKLPLTVEEMAASPEGEEVALRLRGRARDRWSLASPAPPPNPQMGPGKAEPVGSDFPGRNKH